MVEISTSLLSIEKEDAVKTIYNLEAAKTDYFHIDVMDGKFVKNDTNEIMLEYCGYLKNITNTPLDIHLMVENVEEYMNMYEVFKPNIITFHYEAAKEKKDIEKWIKLIKENNCKVGISIKPNTNVEDIFYLLPYIHLVLIMSVEPGVGGQKFIPGTIDKIKHLKEYINKKNLEVDIEVDGGINLDNADEIKKAGCDIIVAGVAIVKSENFAETIKKLAN